MSYERYWVGRQGVQKVVGDPPCHECPDRHPGCHSDCKRGYAEWQNKLRKAQQAYNDACKPGKDVAGVRVKGKVASIRESGRTVNETCRGGCVPGRKR